MTIWFVVIFVLMVASALLDQNRRASRRRPRSQRPAAVANYEAQPLLVNDSERAAWHLLHELPLGAHAVCPKVRMEDFLQALGPEKERLRGYVKSRHVDFLLIDKACRPLLAIEIDGSSHKRPDRVWRDARVNEALSAAGVPFLRLRVGEDWRARLLAWHAAHSGASAQVQPPLAPHSSVPVAGGTRRRA